VVDNRRLGALVVEDTAGARTWLDDEIRAARGLAGFANRLLEPSVAARERPLAAFVESNVVPMAISDPEGIMLYANDALGELLGMPAARIIGRRAAELTPLPQSPMPELARLRATGHTPVLSRFLVRELKRADGTVLEIELCMISFKVAEQAFVGYVIRTLSEAERRFRATFADAPLGIVHLDLAGGVIRVNRRFCELVGRSERELRPFISGLDIEAPADQRGPPIAEVLGGDDSLRPERLRALLAGGARHRVERRLVRPDGSAVSLELTFTLAADEAGAAAYVIGTAVDMTSVHAATEALSAVAHATTITGEALFDTLVEAVAQALGARTALVARLGDTVPPRLRTLALWHDGAVRPARELALVDTPAEHVSRVGLAYYPAGVRQLFPDDALLRELGSDTYMGAALRDPQGRTIGVIAVLGDRRFDEARRPESILRLCASRAEAELQRLDAVAQLAAREGQLRQITESMREGFFLATWPGWQVIYASPSFTELYGRSAAELYGRPNGWLDSVHPEDRARVEAIMASPEPLDLDLDHRIIRPDGQMRWLHVRAQLVPSPDGPPTRAAGFVEDVTTLRLTQETLRERERRLAEALLASEEEIVRLQTRLGDSPGLKGLVGSSPAMREAVARLRLAARSDVTVLITGESGTGKELAAAALHEMSGRRARPFVAINCAAIPEPLLESELFGHVKGAFTGATRDKVGLIQMADTGTLFLDEIGDMSPVLQVKVLRALQERQVRRVGDERAIPVDVRLISATHRDLRAQIASGRTREDFYYRIKVFEVELPPLRARKDDVPELALHFVSELCHAAGRTPPGVSADVLRALVQHDWPGNVRELRNAIEHALVSAVGSAIRLADLPVEIRVAAARALQPMATTVPMATPVAPVASATPGEDERVRIEAALERTGGNRSEAAKLLGVSRVTLWKRMRRLGLGAATSDAGEADESTDEQPPRR
jgi:two-component system response regulator HydG